MPTGATTDTVHATTELDDALPGGQDGVWVWPGTPTSVEVDERPDGGFSAVLTALPASARTAFAAFLGSLTAPS